MTVRPFRESDRAMLALLAGEYPYPDPASPAIEALLVIEDDSGCIVAACAAERIVQLYLWCDPLLHPAAKLHTLRLLHCEMAPILKKKDYTEANAFIPPTLAQRFGRRLAKSFGWVENWRSWCIRF